MLGTVLKSFGKRLSEKFVKKVITNIKKEKFTDIIKKIKEKANNKFNKINKVNKTNKLNKKKKSNSLIISQQ